MVGQKVNVKVKRDGSHLGMLKEGSVFLQAKWPKCFRFLQYSFFGDQCF